MSNAPEQSELDQLNREIHVAIAAGTEAAEFVRRIVGAGSQSQISALAWIIDNDVFPDRIPADIQENITLAYFAEAATRNDPDRLSFSRYECLHELRERFEAAWTRGGEGDHLLLKIERVLRHLAAAGQALADGVAVAVFEHLFTDSRKMSFFSHWREDPHLGSVFEDGSEFSGQS